MRLDVIVAYAYIIVSLFVKPVLLALFMCCCGGSAWMLDDQIEEKDWSKRHVKGRIVTGLRSGTGADIFGKLYDFTRKVCPICQKEIKWSEDRLSVPNCTDKCHYGHSECINTELMGSMECPICKLENSQTDDVSPQD